MSTLYVDERKPSTLFRFENLILDNSQLIRNNCEILGNLIVGGNVISGNLTGNITGNLTGDVSGNVVGDVSGNLYSDFIFEKTVGNGINLDGVVIKDGNVIGNVVGDLTGNVIGDVSGNLTGNVIGDITGDVIGNVIGNVVGDVVGNLTGNVYTDFILERTVGNGLNVDGLVIKDGNIGSTNSVFTVNHNILSSSPQLRMTSTEIEMSFSPDTRIEARNSDWSLTTVGFGNLHAESNVNLQSNAGNVHIESGTQTNFAGTVDFSGASVVGLPSGGSSSDMGRFLTGGDGPKTLNITGLGFEPTKIQFYFIVPGDTPSQGYLMYGFWKSGSFSMASMLFGADGGDIDGRGTNTDCIRVGNSDGVYVVGDVSATNSDGFDITFTINLSDIFIVWMAFS